MTKKRQPDGCQKAASAALQSVSEIRHDESSSEACGRSAAEGERHEVPWLKCLHEKRQPEDCLFSVEMGGVGPPSKQRPRELSTRLFLLWLSTSACRRTGQPGLIL